MNDNTTVENMHAVLHTQVYRAVSHTTSHTQSTHTNLLERHTEHTWPTSTILWWQKHAAR